MPVAEVEVAKTGFEGLEGAEVCSEGPRGRASWGGSEGDPFSNPLMQE